MDFISLAFFLLFVCRIWRVFVTMLVIRKRLQKFWIFLLIVYNVQYQAENCERVGKKSMAQSFEDAQQKYREWMEGELQNLTEKLGLGFHQVAGHHLDWMKVYFILQAVERKRTEKQEFEPPRPEPLGLPSDKVEYEHSAPLDEILKKTQRLVITGDPGSGKTTSLLYLLSMLLQQKEDEKGLPKDEKPVPLFLQLKQIAPRIYEGGSLADIILAELQRCGSIDDPSAFLFAAVQNHALWLLMDGMDEVPADQKEKVLSAILDWVNTYRDIPCVVTSRPGGVDLNCLVGEEWRLREYSLRPLKTDKDTVFFMEKWLAVLDPQQGQKKGKQLFDALKDRLGVKNALRNPLLLRMLIDLYYGDDYRVDNLPWSRSEIYESYIIGPMLKQANISNFPDYQKETALQMLEYIAWYIHGAKRELSQGELIEKLRKYFPEEEHWEAWFAFFSDRMRILVALQDPSRQFGGWAYAFSHRTFQEYFVARKLASLWKERNRGRRWVWSKVLHERFWDPHWQEVILLLCSVVATGKRNDEKIKAGEWYINVLKKEKCGDINYQLIAKSFTEGIYCTNDTEKKMFQILFKKRLDSSYFLNDLISILNQNGNSDDLKYTAYALGRLEVSGQ